MVLDRTTTNFKEFQKTFDLISRKHSVYNSFDDFLDLFVHSFCFNYKGDIERIRANYSQDERFLFGKLISYTLLIQKESLKFDTDCFDFFGSFYELYSISKKSGFAQFFTPMHICKFMAQIVDPKSNETLVDPCCGSGRFSIAGNSSNQGMFHFLVDLDITCAKMAALNLLLHGIQGIVICDDGLFPGSNFLGAFVVNRLMFYKQHVEIEYLDNANEAYNYVRMKTKNYENVTFNNDSSNQNFDDIKIIIGVNGQYKMF